jgi:hypothetical protein
MVRDGKLRVFQDGSRHMYKADEVDALSGGGEAESEGEEIELAPEDSAAGGEMEIELTPADSAADAVDLSEADVQTSDMSKEDTVITADGISIFDDEDLDVEPADPMAKTQLTPSLEDQMNLEGVGSGSGLLDLTRENDDTSLGAEVLDHIDMDDSMVARNLADEAEETRYPAADSFGPEAPAPAPQVVLAEPAEQIDGPTGLFSGLIIGCALMGVLLMMVMFAAAGEFIPAYLNFLGSNLLIVLGAAVGLLLICAVLGYVAGKSQQQKQQTSGPTA